MSNYKIKEVNCETGEEIIRDMTAQEIAQDQADQLEHEAKIAKIASDATAKAALLAKLGISAEEAALLLG